jgi:hypothetical protein
MISMSERITSVRCKMFYLWHVSAIILKQTEFWLVMLYSWILLLIGSTYMLLLLIFFYLWWNINILCCNRLVAELWAELSMVISHAFCWQYPDIWHFQTDHGRKVNCSCSWITFTIVVLLFPSNQKQKKSRYI